MKKVGYLFLCFAMMISSLTLTACFRKKEVVRVISVSACLNESGFSRSKKGSCLTYYHNTNDEITIYSLRSWRTGVVSCKKYFIDRDLYLLEKDSYSWDKAKPDEYMLYKKEYERVDNPDALWEEIHNSDYYHVY